MWINRHPTTLLTIFNQKMVSTLIVFFCMRQAKSSWRQFNRRQAANVEFFIPSENQWPLFTLSGFTAPEVEQQLLTLEATHEMLI